MTPPQPLKHKLVFLHEDEDGTSIRYETSALMLDDVVEAFAAFLRGVGYSLDGLEVTQPEERTGACGWTRFGEDGCAVPGTQCRLPWGHPGSCEHREEPAGGPDGP